MSRSGRAETRQSRKEDIKRVMHSIDKVRHWEKKLVTITDTTMKVYKWMPVSQLKKKIPHDLVQEQQRNRRLFEDNQEAERVKFAPMDEDSNISTASDSMDGMAPLPTTTPSTTATTESLRESQKEGFKRSTSVKEGKYTGAFSEEGRRSGHGEYIWPNGDRYQGQFTDGIKEGNGILYFSNGDKRVGVWKDGKLHGPATYYYDGSGRIDEEFWDNDNKVSEKRRK